MSIAFDSMPAPAKSIDRDALNEVLRVIGIPARWVRSIVIEPRQVTVTTFAENDAGQKIPLGDGVVTVMYTIPIR